MASEFVKKYPPKAPNLQPHQNTPEQLKLFGSDLGVECLTSAPIKDVKMTSPPTREQAKGAKTLYVWLICPEPSRVMYADEFHPNALAAGYSRICHSNLNGASPASGGGEMWFADTHTLIINGSSGRYPIESLTQLEDAAKVFKRLGYKAAHGGWDDDLDMPRRMVREEDITWL